MKALEPHIHRKLIEMAAQVREYSLHMTAKIKASHVAGCLSATDILVFLYGHILNIDPKKPQDPARDRFILSKGHSAAALYATLAVCEFFDPAELQDYCQPGARLGGHVTSGQIPGVEFSTGSLGHGLPVAVGMAFGLRYTDSRVIVLTSDGEWDEGSNWEALLMAPHLNLSRLLLIIDYNQIQGLGRIDEVMPLEPFREKFSAFRWNVVECNGHDFISLQKAFYLADQYRQGPTAIMAHTVKGKGVSFMENQLQWHYRSTDPEQLQIALQEVRTYCQQALLRIVV